MYYNKKYLKVNYLDKYLLIYYNIVMYKIIKYPNIILRKAAKTVSSFDSKLKKISEDMYNIMIKDNGIGLAGPQVNINQKIIIVGNMDNKEYKAYINPEITYFSKDKDIEEEGCLSLPNIFGLVKRSKKIHLKYYDLEGQKVKEKIKGLKATVIQHEIDHLNGILFIDKAFQITKRQDLLDKLKNKLEANE